MPTPLLITIESWLRSGRVGTLKPGDTHHDVLAVLGQPISVGPTGHQPIPGYWLYGVVEFGFTDTGIIEWIQADTVNIDSEYHTCENLKLDWQGIHHNMAIGACVDWLRHRNLAHNLEKDGDGGRLTIEDNAQFLFCNEHDPALVTVWSPPMTRR